MKLVPHQAPAHPLKFLVFLVCANCCSAAAPEAVAEHVLYVSQPFMHGAYSQAYALGADGIARGLFTYRFVYPGGAENMTPPPGGAYSYRKIDDDSAELNLVGERYTIRFMAGSSEPLGNAAERPYEFRFARISPTAAMINCSNRSFVRSGGAAFTGFVINGSARFVLVRAVGPGLQQFGEAELLPTPRLRITNQYGAGISSNDGWRTGSADSIRNTGALVGAFPLPSSSTDCALILRLGPGAHIAEVSSSAVGDSGQVLIEVYLLP